MRFIISKGTDIIKPEEISEWGADELITVDELAYDLSNLPQDKKSQCVLFIPTIFDISNSLSYEGADLALKIVMRYLRDGISDFNTVLMGFESEENFLLHYSYPNLLKIPGISYIRFNKKIVSQYIPYERDCLKVDEYIPFLDNLGLKIPSSFKSTHSLTNEWCLFKWNSFFGFDDNAQSLMGHLYFEYLITLEKLTKVETKSATEHLKERIKNIPSARILLIDDNIGWHVFFATMFGDNPNVEIQCLGENFNKLLFTEISNIIEEKVNQFNPHIIILDFRLMEDQDAEIKDDMKLISGYKVLKDILKGNYVTPKSSFGRQVLIFTATSRIENILMLREGYADGFILKEKPENYNGKEITKDIVSKMVSLMRTAIERASFLIPLSKKLNKLMDMVTNPSYKIGSNLVSTINYTTQSVRQITQNNKIDEDVLKLIYLNIFNIFEEIKRDITFIEFPTSYSLVIHGVNRLIVSEKSKCAMTSRSDDDWNYKPNFTPSSRHEKFYKDKNLNFAICALILFRLGKMEVDETDWNKIRIIRNAIAHGDDSKLIKECMSLDIITLRSYILSMLDLLITIIDKDRINEVTPILTL